MLLVGAVLLDAAALAMLVASNWTMVILEGSGCFAWLVGAARRLWRPRRRWSETITQMNLISYSLRTPCSEARLFFKSIGVSRWHFLGDEEACRIPLSRLNQATEDVEKPSTGVKDKEEDSDERRSVLLDALMLAAELNKLDDETRWQVVAGVWGEMLTFVACRGSSAMGELVTMVSFLMNHLGLGNMF
ncbi:hypothetical protein BRADI_2g21160v3 [Brachypodium distachyon]|uniref:DUF4220 domain-containing protein n=1 Tax=Brachypodium distachyon TaxID=15368 RepID=I1HI34_BRADI|nr:hypothetical protein BRADI_2g21160v3 [Brachypodium distachyon]